LLVYPLGSIPSYLGHLHRFDNPLRARSEALD
jgi:hypothetical protein